MFLSDIGSKTYSLLCNLLVPTPPKDMSFKDLVSTLKEHFEPKPITVAERFIFHWQQQAEGETVAEYVSELQRLTVHCEFAFTLKKPSETDLFVGLGVRQHRRNCSLKQNSPFRRRSR